jgi:hypothetical protein
MRLHLGVLISVFMFSLGAAAQQDQEDPNEQKYGFEWGIHTGPLLPNQVEDVTEIMPTWGVRVGIPHRKATVEVGANSSRAYGTTIYDGFVSYRGDIVVESLTGIFYAGLDLYHLTPPESSGRVEGGGHIGAGLMTIIGDVAWFRADMKFNINPGTALYIGFGVVFRLPESQDNQTTP